VTSVMVLTAWSLPFGTSNSAITPSIGKNVPTLSTQLSSRIICMVFSPVCYFRC